MNEKTFRRKKREIIGMAARLARNPSEEEKWFWEKYTPIKDLDDLPSKLIRGYGHIYDVVNARLMYVIEIDDNSKKSVNKLKQAMTKSQAAWSKGFEVFRITAYSDESYEKFLVKLAAYKEKRALKQKT